MLFEVDGELLRLDQGTEHKGLDCAVRLDRITVVRAELPADSDDVALMQDDQGDVHRVENPVQPAGVRIYAGAATTVVVLTDDPNGLAAELGAALELVAATDLTGAACWLAPAAVELWHLATADSVEPNELLAMIGGAPYKVSRHRSSSAALKALLEVPAP